MRLRPRQSLRPRAGLPLCALSLSDQKATRRTWVPASVEDPGAIAVCTSRQEGSKDWKATFAFSMQTVNLDVVFGIRSGRIRGDPSLFRALRCLLPWTFKSDAAAAPQALRARKALPTRGAVTTPPDFPAVTRTRAVPPPLVESSTNTWNQPVRVTRVSLASCPWSPRRRCRLDMGPRGGPLHRKAVG